MYAAIFLHEDPEIGTRKLISAPESIEAENPDVAKREGLQILNEIAEEHKIIMRPLSIVELSDDMMTGIAGCERVFLPMTGEDGDNGEELEFVDVSQSVYWQSQPWWSR